METVLVDEVEEEEKLVEVDELLVKDEELVDICEKDDAPCMFLRYDQFHGPLMVVTTCTPSSTPFKKYQ